MGGEGTVVKKDQTFCLTQSVMKMRNFVLIFDSEDKILQYVQLAGTIQMKATKQFSTMYVQNWTLMRFVPIIVDITKCPPSTHPHLNTNNTVKQKDIFYGLYNYIDWS